MNRFEFTLNYGEAGFNEIGEELGNHNVFIQVDDLEHALHAHNFLNEHSAAVSSHMYYQGLHGVQAEEVVLNEIVTKKQLSEKSKK